MALRERKGSWQADVYWKGKRYRKDFKSKVEAQAWIDDTKERLRKGVPLDARLDDNPEAAGMTLNRLLELTASIRWKNQKDGERSEQQAREMVNMLGGALHPSQVTAVKIAHLIEKLRAKGLSGATINRYTTGLSVLLTSAQKMGVIKEVPFIPRQQEGEGRERVLTAEEEQSLIKHFARRRAFQDLFLVMLDTGMRIEEACQLRFDDVEDGVIRVRGKATTSTQRGGTKNGKARSVPMTQRVRKILSRRIADRPEDEVLVFWDCDQRSALHGTPAIPAKIKRRAQDRFKFWRDNVLKLPNDHQLVPHTLRHTFGSRLAQAGADVLRIAKLMGHSDLKMSERYIHMNTDDLERDIRAMETRARASVGDLDPVQSGASGVADLVTENVTENVTQSFMRLTA